MSWQEISIAVPYEYVEPVSYLFSRYGHGLAMDLDGTERVVLRTYLQSTSQQRLARIEVGVRLIASIQPVGELSIKPISDDEDWQNSWKSQYTMLKVGRHLVIKPSWIEYQPEPEDVVVELDPGMAFGTGYHPTTYTCLEALEALVQPGMTVLDVGTGSGILTIAALKLGVGKVVALDIDPVAVRAARQNFRRSGVLRQVSLAEGSVPNPLARDSQFDLVVANISARIGRERAPFILPALKPHGALILSGIMIDQQEDTQEALQDTGFVLERVYPREEWVSMVFRRPPEVE